DRRGLPKAGGVVPAPEPVSETGGLASLRPPVSFLLLGRSRSLSRFGAPSAKGVHRGHHFFDVFLATGSFCLQQPGLIRRGPLLGQGGSYPRGAGRTPDFYFESPG